MSSATIGIIPCTYFRGNNKPVGSSFLRVDGLVKNNTDFEKWKHGKMYEALIFQKAYWKEMMELYQGPMILDLCDPDWIKNGVDIKKIGGLVHGITCSSDKMATLLKGYFPDKPVWCIPDRLDVDFYPPMRPRHTGAAKSVVWFGFIQNAHETLHIMAPIIRKHNLSLTIISHLPYSKNDEILALNPTYYEFNHETAYQIIQQADMVLNPKSDLAFFKYKSSNKSLIGWLLGLAVAESPEDLEMLMNPDKRNEQVEDMRKVVINNFHINQSAEQYRQLINLINETQFSEVV